MRSLVWMRCQSSCGSTVSLPALARAVRPGVRRAGCGLRAAASAGYWCSGSQREEAGMAGPRARLAPPVRVLLGFVCALVLGATFLAAAATESALSPLAGRLADRRGALVPIQLSLAAAVAVSLLAPLLEPEKWLVALLIVGMPAYGTLFAPATALLSAGAHRLQLNQGLAFGMGNLAWASGQAIASAAGGALAQATSDLVPYALLAAACLATLATVRPAGRRLMTQVLRHPSRQEQSSAR